MITKEAYLKHKDIIDAWANGKTIEVKHTGWHVGWHVIADPFFDLNTEYRIRPEPETIYKIVLGRDGMPTVSNFSYDEREMEGIMKEYPLCRFQKFVAVED